MKPIQKFHIPLLAAVSVLLLGGCSSEEPGKGADAPDAGARQEMKFDFRHPSASRVDDAGFQTGDRVGLYVKRADLPLEIGGNLVNNEPMTFDGSAWRSRNPLYLEEGEAEAYAYYPYAPTVVSVTDFPFAVATDQRDRADGGSGYEDSDLLFAHAEPFRVSAAPVEMTFRHLMSRLTVRLVRGEGYEGELPEDVTVIIHNTVPSATVDLEAGVATRDPRAVRGEIVARRCGTGLYAAIVVPQRLDARVPLVEVVTKKASLLYESNFIFRPGMNHTVTLLLEHDPDRDPLILGADIAQWH